MLALAALVLGLAPVPEGEAITIKTSVPKVGQVGKETKTSTESVNVNGTAGGNLIKEENKKTSTSVFTEEAVEVPAGAKKPTKFKRTYEKAETTDKAGETKKVSIEGKTVLIEKKDKEYEFTVDGKPVAADAKEFLGAELSGKKDDDSFEVLLPKGPVKAGDTWKIDLAKVAKEFEENMEIDAAKSTGTGKLVKAYTKDGATWGVMEVTIDLAITKFGTGMQSFPVKPGALLSLKFVLDGCLDGTAEAGKAVMTMKGKVEADIPMVEIAVDMDIKQESTREPVKK